MISGVYPTCLHSEDNFFVWQEHDKATILDKQKDLEVQVSYVSLPILCMLLDLCPGVKELEREFTASICQERTASVYI